MTYISEIVLEQLMSAEDELAKRIYAASEKTHSKKQLKVLVKRRNKLIAVIDSLKKEANE